MSVVSFIFRLIFLLAFTYVLLLGLSYLMWIATTDNDREHGDDFDIELDEYDYAFGEV